MRQRRSCVAVPMLLAISAGGCSILVQPGENARSNGDGGGDAGVDAGGTLDLCVPPACSVFTVVRSIGKPGIREFGTIQEWEDERQGDLIGRVHLAIEGSANFPGRGTLVTGAPSGCSGSYVEEGRNSADTFMSLDDVVGECQPGDTLSWGNGEEVTLLGYLGIGTVEKGELYNDRDFVNAFRIDGAITDSAHYMWLGAAAGDNQRHLGVPGGGVRLRTTNFAGHVNVMRIDTDYTRVDWLELTEWALQSSADGILVTGRNILLDHLLIHADDVGPPLGASESGIVVDNYGGASATISNSIIFDISFKGIEVNGVATATILNCTLAKCAQREDTPVSDGCVVGEDVGPSSPTITTINTVAAGLHPTLSTNDFVGVISGDYNASVDGSAVGTNSRTLTPAQMFTDPDAASVPGLEPASELTGKGQDLGGRSEPDLSISITGEARIAPWNIGAF